MDRCCEQAPKDPVRGACRSCAKGRQRRTSTRAAQLLLAAAGAAGSPFRRIAAPNRRNDDPLPRLERLLARPRPPLLIDKRPHLKPAPRLSRASGDASRQPNGRARAARPARGEFTAPGCDKQPQNSREGEIGERKKHPPML